MADYREEFLNGVLAFSDAMRANNLTVSDMTITVSEKDGRRMEHMLTQRDMFVISAQSDPRYSTGKADKHLREFMIAGVRFQYKTKPYLMPNGDII